MKQFLGMVRIFYFYSSCILIANWTRIAFNGESKHLKIGEVSVELHYQDYESYFKPIWNLYIYLNLEFQYSLEI